jgi:hypothetical protein
MNTLAKSHPIERAWDRYGIRLTIADLRELENRLASGAGVLLRRENHDEAVLMVDVQGQSVVVALDTKSTKIKTFLPPQTASRNRRWRLMKSMGIEADA